MGRLPIRIYGDEILRKKAEPIDFVNGELHKSRLEKLVEDMLETMYAGDGIGLAANQVGVLERIIVIDLGEAQPGIESGPRCYINPEIVSRAGVDVMEEGCLSFPNIRAEVKRPSEIEVKALDLEGKSLHFQADGLFARVLLHEIDHLDGVLFIDYLSPMKKLLLREQLKELEKRAQMSGGRE